MRMLSGTSLAPSDIVAIAPPDLVELTVGKIAINAEFSESTTHPNAHRPK